MQVFIQSATAAEDESNQHNIQVRIIQSNREEGVTLSGAFNILFPDRKSYNAAVAGGIVVGQTVDMSLIVELLPATE